MIQDHKTIRVRVLKPFYLTRDKIAGVGEEIDLPVGQGMELVHAQKAIRLTPPPQPLVITDAPEVDPFRTPAAKVPKKESAK